MEKVMKKSEEVNYTNKAFSIIKEDGIYKVVTIEFNPKDTSKINLTKSNYDDSLDVAVERFKILVSENGLLDPQN